MLYYSVAKLIYMLLFSELIPDEHERRPEVICSSNFCQN